ncbi:hypothetical protein E2C01_001162 [Portunus trituberculatus]|uniref:Uncharacterized protein n=1 Tax=Portunus trituberculatus TaxID=210409 RepID=A0A5B7CIP8_PORTR|nr:hypothetical protein [Portunus trituberculatus]
MHAYVKFNFEESAFKVRASKESLRVIVEPGDPLPLVKSMKGNQEQATIRRSANNHCFHNSVTEQR